MTEWNCRHFSLTNPRADQSAPDVAALLRRAADQIDARGIQPEQILDMTVSAETTDVGPWWSARSTGRRAAKPGAVS